MSPWTESVERNRREAVDSAKDDEKNSGDWQQFSEYYISKEGCSPTYGDRRVMMLFDYYSKGRFHEWFKSQ